MVNRFEPRRRWPWLVLLCLAALVALRLWQQSNSRSPETLSAGDYRIRRVLDGDTLALDNAARVRLIGVDAPETESSPRGGGADQPFAQEARRFVEQAIAGSAVRLEFDKERVDKYGRFLAYVWYRDSTHGEELLLNEELVRAGLAVARLHYSYSEKMKRRFRAAEQEARAARRGVWAEAEEQPDAAGNQRSPLSGARDPLIKSAA